MNAGAIIAAQVAAKQREIMTELREAGATRRDKATAFQRPQGGNGRIFDGLVKRGLIGKTGDHRYFLTDKGAKKLEAMATSGPKVLLILLVVFSILASVIGLAIALGD